MSKYPRETWYLTKEEARDWADFPLEVSYHPHRYGTLHAYVFREPRLDQLWRFTVYVEGGEKNAEWVVGKGELLAAHRVYPHEVTVTKYLENPPNAT